MKPWRERGERGWRWAWKRVWAAEQHQGAQGRAVQERERGRETGTEHLEAPQELLEWAGSCVGPVGCAWGAEGSQRGVAEGQARVRSVLGQRGTWAERQGGPPEEPVPEEGLAVELKAVGGRWVLQGTLLRRCGRVGAGAWGACEETGPWARAPAAGPPGLCESGRWGAVVAVERGD